MWKFHGKYWRIFFFKIYEFTKNLHQNIFVTVTWTNDFSDFRFFSTNNWPNNLQYLFLFSLKHIFFKLFYFDQEINHFCLFEFGWARFSSLVGFFFERIHKIEAQLLFDVNNRKNQPIINMQCEEKMDFIWKSNTIEWEVVYTKERSFANWTSCSIWQYLVLVEIIYSSFISNFPFNIRLRLLKRCWAWRCVVWCFFIPLLFLSYYWRFDSISFVIFLHIQKICDLIDRINVASLLAM